MIFNKYVSILLSACLFMLLMFVTSSVVVVFFKAGFVQYVGFAFIVIYYFMARAFYNYLRNDETYKNNRNHSSDKKGESYIVKGSSDIKKIFIVIWVLVILLISSLSLWLYSINMGLV